MTMDSKRAVWRELLARELWPCARKGARSLLATFARSQRFPSAGVATLITIAVALPVFKCADKKTYIYDSSPNTFVLLVEATVSRNDRRFSIRDLDLGRRLSVRSFCRCFYERILRAVSFSGDPFPSQSRVWSGPMERAVFSALLYFYTRARFHYIRWIFDLFVENIKNIGNSPNQRKKRIAIDSNVQHVLG